MTTETINLLIGGVFGILSGAVLNHFSFQKEKHYNHRNKTSYLLATLKKAVGQCKYQSKNINTIIEELEKDIYNIPLLKVHAYPALDLLADTIIKEDYYSSFMHTYKPIVNPDGKFFELEYQSVFLSGQLKQIISLFERAQENHQNRKLKLVAEFETIRDLIETMILRHNGNEAYYNVAALTELIANIFENLKNERKSLSDIKELYDLAIGPLLELDKNIMRLPTEIALHLDKAFHIYHDIEFQNKDLLKNLKELYPPFSANSQELEGLQKFFNSSMIRQFYPTLK